jgi:PAS domain S-box-containing protein
LTEQIRPQSAELRDLSGKFRLPTCERSTGCDDERMARALDLGALNSLPLASQAAGELGRPEPITILLVAAGTTDVSAVSSALAPLGYTVRTVRSGEEALSSLAEQDAALVVIDVLARARGGLQIARQIRSRPAGGELPIVFLCGGRVSLSQLVTGSGSRATDYLLKPIDPELLRSKVSLFIELDAGRRALKQSEAFLRAAFEAAPVGKTILTVDRDIVRTNPSFGRLVGRDPVVLSGTPVLELCHPDDRAELRDALDLVAGGTPVDAAPGRSAIDLRLIRSGGATVWVGLVATLIEPGQLGEPLLLVQWVDLSARRRAERVRGELLVEHEARTHAEAIAIELQRGLLPKQLPEIDGVQLAAHYQAAGTGAQAGGDWYDAFPLVGGRVGVVVGDVAGHGVPAASTMGQLRSVTRAFAAADDGTRSPGNVLTRLNRHQLALGHGELFTVIYALIDLGGGTIAWANAGHPPPVLRTAAGEVRFLEGGEALPGIEDIAYPTFEHRLESGDAVFLYSDGLVERRGESLDAGLSRLALAIRVGPDDPERLCEHVLRAVQLPADQLHDDVTALVARVS